MDKFAKSHPWRADLLQPVIITIGALIVEEPRTGRTQEIAPPTQMPMSPGPRMFRKKGEAIAFVEAYRRDHGDVVSDVYKAA